MSNAADEHLLHHLAPIGHAAWEAIEDEARRSLRHHLAGRAVVDVEEPAGWQAAARTTGRLETLGTVAETAVFRRLSTAFVELARGFVLDRAEIEAIERGARAPDLGAVADAARSAAAAEDTLVFQGQPGSTDDGIAGASPHPPITLTDDYTEYPRHVARGVAILRRAGVGGPYALALGPRCYTGVIETTEHGGYPVLEHVRTILGGPVIWAPNVDGAVIVSLRGGDYVFTPGQDWAVRYRGHTAGDVELELVETFHFEVREPAAAVRLTYAGPA